MKLHVAFHLGGMLLLPIGLAVLSFMGWEYRAVGGGMVGFGLAVLLMHHPLPDTEATTNGETSHGN